MFLDWTKSSFLHLSKLSINCWKLFLTYLILWASYINYLFYSKVIFNILLIVWPSLLPSLSPSSDDMLLSWLPALTSSFLYFDMLFHFEYSFGSIFSKMPDSWSQAQKRYFTTFGNDKSIMLLNKLFTKLFLSAPYDPVRILSYSIIVSSSCRMFEPPSSRHSSNLSYRAWRPSKSYWVVSACDK